MKIELKNLEVETPKGELIFKLNSLTIESGSRILLMGPSGIGKSTLLHLIAGLVTPRSGEVKIAGNFLSSLRPSERSTFRKNNIGVVFQKLNLIPHLSILENLQLANGNPTDKSKIYHLLKTFDLESKKDQMAHELSLGGQQRVAIIRSLLNKPKILLADEPTSSLDNNNALKVIKLLQEVPNECTLLVVSHDERMKSHFKHILNFEELLNK
ncbi:MAG: ABC transporter ATP-binding protein [Bacteriovorax sp.]